MLVFNWTRFLTQQHNDKWTQTTSSSWSDPLSGRVTPTRQCQPPAPGRADRGGPRAWACDRGARALCGAGLCGPQGGGGRAVEVSRQLRTLGVLRAPYPSRGARPSRPGRRDPGAGWPVTPAGSAERPM